MHISYCFLYKIYPFSAFFCIEWVGAQTDMSHNVSGMWSRPFECILNKNTLDLKYKMSHNNL